MNRNFYKIIFIFSLIIFSGKKFYSQNPAACNNTQNLCTNSVFSFSASSGTGLTPGLNVSNPFGNPQAVNAGCMFTNVPNPQWLMINVTSSGNLGFSFGAFGSAFPQAGNYDWIMWPYSPTTCDDIFNNTLPPVACNWNCTGSGGTGMGTVPFGGSACNFQPSIPVLQGQQYLVLITNPSGVNTNVSFANTGSAGISCNPLLYPSLTACPGQLAVFTGTWVNAVSGTYTLYPGAVVQTNPSFTVSSLVNQVYTVQAQGLNTSAGAIADQTTFTLTINPVIPISVTTPTNFCYGSNAAFTINPTGAGSFSVTGPASPTSTFGTTSISIPNITTPNIGTFSVIANYTNGCIGTQTTQVNVAPNHSIAISTNSNVCQEGIVNLTSSMPTATAYAWSGPSAYASALQNPIINTIQPTASGIYTVSSNINFNGITCPRTNTTQISVVPTSTVAVTPNFTLCQGANLNLTSSATPAFSYSWSGPSSYTSGLQNPVVIGILPSGAGNYSVIASFSNSALTCTTGAVSNVSVVATSPVTVAVPNNICQNATANLTVTTSPTPLSYLWSGPNSFTSNLSNPSITNIQPIASGIYSTTATYAIGSVSCTTTGTNQISVVGTNTVAVASNFTVCEASNVNLTSSATGATSYSWNGPGAYNSAVQNPTITSILPSGSGNYTATAFFTNGFLTCTTSALANVSVVATPTTTIIFPANICQNATANFTASAAGAISYTWAGPNSFNSTIATPTIPNIQTNGSGIYTTTTMFAMGTVSCTTNITNSLSVVGTNTVAVSSNFTVCAGANVNLTSNATSAVSYSWNGPGGYTSAQQNPTISGILPSGTGIYTATAFFSNSILTCTTSAVLNGSVIPIPPLNVTMTNSNICTFQSTTITATGAINYTWTPSATLSSSNGASVTANPLATTVYSVTGADASGCLKTNTLMLTVNPLPTLTATSNTMCLGTSASLTVNGAVGYTWTPAGSLNNPNGSTVTATPTTSTIYTITGVSNKGCSGTTTTSVSVKPLPVLAISNHTICSGNSANIGVLGANNYTWSPGTALNATNIANVIANPLQTITYTVIGKDLNGCVQSTISTVVVNPLPVISITSPSAICRGQNALMSSSGAVTYTWNNSVNTSSQSVNPIVTTTYSVVGQDANGCSNTGTVLINVFTQPTLNITGTPTVCVGNAITLSANGGINYNWNTGETTNTITIEPQVNSVYTVSSGISPCNSSTIFAVTVYTPQSQTPFANPSTIIYGSSSVIYANSIAGNIFNWSYSPDISCNSCETNTVSPNTTTIYTITATDNNGCIVTNTVLVQVDILCGDNFVPSAFSPNGDGFNDFWCVYGNCITTMNLQLYNRWGEKVFESDNKNNCWDGTYNGVMQNDAVFIYQLTAILINGEKVVKKGNVTLKR
ncbi:MAG: gliding motility-associated C-terminal domain-containing protein [Bacteroidota bacterium]|nr:gliding motility-associated C-terminal domain-containing protein [Bacteroidota bacterium]MDP3143876.1 gliding motility-associated C-terminal domain-containing protein [Bacteroidota bacterium]